MTARRNSNVTRLEEKVLAIREGRIEDKLTAADVIVFSCLFHQSNGMYQPIPLTTLSKFNPTGQESYLSDVIKDFNNGRAQRLSRNCAAFMMNMTGKTYDFWLKKDFTLADAESVTITLPGELKPETTIAPPSEHSLGVKTKPTARDLAKAVLYPDDLDATSIARIMKAAQTERS